MNYNGVMSINNYVNVLSRENRRTLSISISNTGNVTVKAPINMPLSEINKFVFEKKDWIEKKLNLIKNMLADNTDIINYKKILFLGNCYKPFWSDVKKISLDEYNRILIPQTMTETELFCNIRRFLIEQARTILTQRVISIAETMNLSPRNIKLSNAKKKWGSCSSKRIISLNWRLIMLPTKLIDYIIVHELSHIFYMDHSNKFWALVKTYIPNLSTIKNDLKMNSYILNLFR